MGRQCRSSFTYRRSAVAGMIILVGMMLSGRVDEYIRDTEAAAEDLEQSDEFSSVNFAYEDHDPMTRPRSLYDYSAALYEDADLDEAGRLLAESAETSIFVPDILVDGSTWVQAFQRWKGVVPDFTAEQWTEVLETARTTHAQEVEVWKHEQYRAEELDDPEPKIAFTTRSEKATEGFNAFEAFEDAEIPAGIGDEHVYVQLQAGTDSAPWSYEMREVGERWVPGPDYRVFVEGPRDSDIRQARTLYEAAERDLGEVVEFNLVYLEPMHRESEFSLEILHAGEYEACDDNIAYAAMVRELLDTEVEIQLSYAEHWNDIPSQIYDDTQSGRAAYDGNDPTQECYPSY